MRRAQGTLATCRIKCARPTGDSHGRITRGPAQRTNGQSAGRAQEGNPKSAAQDSIEAGVIDLASLQRGNLILARIATTLLHERLPWVTIVLYPTASESWEVYARYALLGTRSAGGGRRPGHCVGVVPIGPPLALAASYGPGNGTHGRFPRPANGERWAR